MLVNVWSSKDSKTSSWERKFKPGLFKRIRSDG
jgi:hypothetical protein